MHSKFHGGDTARPASDSSFVSRFTGSALKGKKSRAALALAVSLWIANGGVASAQETTVASNYTGDVYGNHTGDDLSNNSGNPNDNTVTVNEGVTASGDVYGSLGTDNAAAERNKVIINGTVTGFVYGGQSGKYKNANSNMVTINGEVKASVYGGTGTEHYSPKWNMVTIKGTAWEDVYGGVGEEGAEGNSVTVINGTVKKNVYGGYINYDADAVSNQVTLSGATVEGNVYGGYTKDFHGFGNKTTNNQVTLNGATVGGNVYGGFSERTGDVTTGNTLYLFGASTAGGAVENFEKIVLQDSLDREYADGTEVKTATYSLAWQDGAALLSAKEFKNCGTLDISAATNLKNATPGTMTLLSAGNTDAFADMPLKYFNSGTATLNTTGITVFTDEATNAKNGVTLAYDATHTVKLEDSNKKVTYNVTADPVKAVTLGEIAWDTSTAARTMTTEGLTFNGTTVIDASKLAFTNPEAIAKDASMTLLAGATGLTSSNTVTGGTGVAVAYTDAKGIKLEATAKGAVSVDSNDVKYTINSVNLNKATLGSFVWGAEADSLPEGWTASADTTIDATKFEYTYTDRKANISVAKDTTSTILNAPGLTKDSKVEGGANIKVAVEDTNEEGIRFEATATGHVEVEVEATEQKVQYRVDSVALKNVDLGGWDGEVSGVPQDWTGSQVTVSTGNFNVPALAAGQSRDILTTSVANYFGTVSGDRKYSSETFENSEAGVTLSGNHIGGVKVEAYGEAANAKLTYYAETMDTTAIALGEMTWGTARDASGMAYNYANVTDANLNVSGLTFTNPEDVTGTTTLLAANDTLPAGLADVAKPISYQYNPVAGVTVEGAINGSVSKNGANIVYTTTENKANKLTFGAVAWGGTLIDHSKTLTNISFDGAAVDTSNISFTNVNSLASGDSMTLVSAFGTRVGTITGSAFSIGSLTGAGHAYFENNNLLYLVTEGTGGATPTDDSDVSGETKTAPQGKTTGNITGASTGSGTATSNTAEVPSGAEVTGNITGAVTADGEAKENAANVTGGTVTGDVAGAVTTDGVANSNSATVSGGGTVTGSVTGAGAKGSGTANGNQASVSGPNTNVTGSVTGAVTAKGAAAENTANVSGGSTVTGDVMGAVTGGNGAAVANSAVVSGSETKVKRSGTEEEGGDVIGAATVNGTASQNTATVTDSEIAGSVCGGNSETGEVNTNTATVSGGTVNGSVFGGHTEGAKAADANRVVLENEAEVKGSVYGGKSDKGASNGNVVEISKATVDGYVFGAASKNASTNNSVAMADGLVSGLVGGGCEVSTGNSVTVTGGIVREYAVGGLAGATATDNTVLMTGGYVLNGVYGGYGKTTAASGNNVYLGGGTVIGGTTEDAATIEGFTLKDKGVYGGYSESGTTQNNSVTLYGTANVSTADLYGGNREATGNILHIGGVAEGAATPWTGGGNVANSISNFEQVSFDVVKWNTPALVVGDGISNFSGTISAENVVFTGTESLAKGDVMTLAKNLPMNVKAEADSAFYIGTTTEGKGTVSLNNQGSASYTVDSVSASRQSHNTVMAAEAAMAALSMGNDFIGAATEGLAQAANVGADGVSTFARMGGGVMRQETGSHVDSHTWNAIIALGHQNKKERGTTEYGAFFEYGTGNYTTHNDDSQRGDGSTKYTGGGLLAKWTANHGFYVEGSFRAGTVNDDARNMLRDLAGNGYSYDANANYFGAHLGVGKEIPLANGNTVDVYGKYFYNRKNGVNFNAGGHYDLDAVTSQVIRVGARYTVKQSKWNLYAGVAYEHELDGKASGTADGMTIRGADTNGGSFRGELGASVTPDKNVPVTLDFNVTGFAGKKQGFSGGVSVAFMF